METHCPDCNTRYQVDDSVLAICGGEVRCYHCERVFNVLEAETGYQVDLGESSIERAVAADSQALDQQPLIVELRHAPDGPTNEAPAAEPPQTPTLAAVEPSIPVDGDVEEPEAAPPIDLTDASIAPARHWFRTLLRSLLIIALALGALGQWGWLERDRLLAHPKIRPFLTQLGDRFDFSLPPQVDPKLFRVLRRDLAPDVQNDGALVLRAVVRNDSLITQPLPALQLTLFDSAQNIVARRTFSPTQYLPDPNTEQLIAPQQVFTLQLALEDPGDRASGFELSFY